MKAGNYARFKTVLNARRHRRGNHATSQLSAMATPRVCSTPEGIGGGITASSLAGRLHRPRAQRPKASEGESQMRAQAATAWLLVLNARRHRRGTHGYCERSVALGLLRAQRPKASEGESRSTFEPTERLGVVCSTPEGIGGGITIVAREGQLKCGVVLNARRHRRGNHGNHTRGVRCDTVVLNARRHRRGNHGSGSKSASWCDSGCSTPEGIGGGITGLARPALECTVFSAQRPKASEGESPAHTLRQVTGFYSGAQRPKASEGESRP